MGMDRILHGTAALDDVLLFALEELSGIPGVLIERTEAVPILISLPFESLRRGETEPEPGWIEVHVLPDFVNVETRRCCAGRLGRMESDEH